MMDNPVTIVGIVGVTVASITGLVVWLVKHAFKRQGEITDRYFGHLEKRDEQNQQMIDRFGDTMEKVNQNLDEHTRLLKHIADRQDTTCRHGATRTQ